MVKMCRAGPSHSVASEGTHIICTRDLLAAALRQEFQACNEQMKGGKITTPANEVLSNLMKASTYYLLELYSATPPVTGARPVAHTHPY